MILLLHPDPSLRLIRAAQWHDVIERWIGDIPGFVKEYEPRFADAEKALENAVLAKLPFIPHPSTLLPMEKQWLKACDMLEFWMWILDEHAMGNTYPTAKIRRIQEWFSRAKQQGQLPDVIWLVYQRGHVIVGDHIQDNGEHVDHKPYPDTKNGERVQGKWAQGDWKESRELDGDRAIPEYEGPTSFAAES
jgi:hypothetical protein